MKDFLKEAWEDERIKVGWRGEVDVAYLVGVSLRLLRELGKEYEKMAGHFGEARCARWGTHDDFQYSAQRMDVWAEYLVSEGKLYLKAEIAEP